AGLDLHQLDLAFDFTQRCSQNGGLLVVRHGYLAFERYYGRANRNANPDMASTGKAYTSIACGIMLSEFRRRSRTGSTRRSSRRSTCPRRFRWTIPAAPTSHSV